MSHEHELDGAYLSPSDTAVLDVEGSGDDFRVVVVIPCQECDEPLEVTLSVDEIAESDLDFPLDDAEAALD